MVVWVARKFQISKVKVNMMMMMTMMMMMMIAEPLLLYEHCIWQCTENNALHMCSWLSLLALSV